MITCIYDYILKKRCTKCMILMHEIACYQCILIVTTFSMSMLSFIEYNKRNEHGEEFSGKLKIFSKFFHFFISYSMHDLIFKHVNRNMIYQKYQKSILIQKSQIISEISEMGKKIKYEFTMNY